MKSYTDIEQSKKLAEILPVETADMCYPKDAFEYNYAKEPVCHYSGIGLAHPCWSLAALLVILAKIASKIDDDGSADLSSFMGQWSVNMLDCPVQATDNYDSAVDACVEMIIKLNELNLL